MGQECRLNSQGQPECQEQQKSMSLDSNWRWTHKDGETTNCYTDSEWDTSVCPDGDTCAQNCAAGAVDQKTWEGTYGVKQNGNGVDVGFVTQGPYSVNVGSRSYMMEDTKEYKLFSMLQKELSFDVDLSNMLCGTNAAIYFSEMEKTGNLGANNKAGAPYGTGYCDGQCARDLKWVNGKANSEGWTPNTADPYNNSGEGNMGACCAEMDIWEANMIASAPQPTVTAATSTPTAWVTRLSTVQALNFKSTPSSHSRLSPGSMLRTVSYLELSSSMSKTA